MLFTSYTNETEGAMAHCRDSRSYRNPFNGYTCSEHNHTVCTDWGDVLHKEQLDELLQSCPNACDLLSECMNNTDANIFHTPNAAMKSSYLEDTSSKARTNSAGAAILWTLGVVLIVFFGYQVRRHRSTCKEPGNFFSGEDEENPSDSQHKHTENASKKETNNNFNFCDIIAAKSANPGPNTLPTPRWLPELNVSVDTDSSGNEESGDEISAAQSRISFGNISVLSPPHSGKNDGIRSPPGSIVHLLGAMRSDEESDDYSMSTKSP